MDVPAANMSASTVPNASKMAVIEFIDTGAMHMNNEQCTHETCHILHVQPWSRLDAKSDDSRGRFSWFKLPAEIRKRILELLLTPYFKLDRDTQTELVEFRVKPVQLLSAYEDYFKGDLAHDLQKMEEITLLPDKWAEELYHQSKPEYRDRTRGELSFIQVKQAFNFERKQYPERISHYCLQASISKRVKTFKRSHKDWPMIDIVRNISNVNTQFRQELGGFLWARTKIIFGSRSVPYDDGAFGAWEPMAFLLDRPAIVKGIKSLHMPLQEDDKNVAQFKVFFKYAAKVMDLVHLTICIEHDPSLKDITALKGVYANIIVVREMKVSKSFRIAFGHWKNPTTVEQVEYAPQLRSILLPDTLRIQDISVVNKKALYLNQRLSENNP